MFRHFKISLFSAKFSLLIDDKFNDLKLFQVDSIFNAPDRRLTAVYLIMSFFIATIASKFSHTESSFGGNFFAYLTSVNIQLVLDFEF